MGNNDIDETKETINEATNLAKNAKSGNIIGAAKNAINLAKSDKWKRKLKIKIALILMKVLIVLLPIILAATALYSIWTAVADRMDDLKENITAFTVNVWKWFTNDYWIDIDQKIECIINGETGETEEETLIEQYMKETEKMGISTKKLRLLGDADYTNEEVMNDPANIKLMQKYLKEFIRADIISQEIHRRRGQGELVNSLNEDEIDGGVYLYRSENELSGGTSLEKRRMTYKTKEDFDKMMNNNDQSIRYHFTIDKQTGELIYAQVNTVDRYVKSGGVWSFVGREVILEEKNCDYKTVISKYTLPYEFLVNLCMVTQNPEFVYRVALMARETEINLVILDNTTRLTDTIEEEITTTTLTNIGSSSPSGAASSESKTETGTKTITTESNPQVVTEKVVDSWMYKGEKIYTNNVTTIETGPSESQGQVDSIPAALADTGTTTEVEVKDSTSTPGSSTASIPTNVKDKVNATKKIQVKVYSSSYISERKITTTTKTEGNTYDEGVVQNEIIKSDDFLGLLRNKDGKAINENDFKNAKVRIPFLETGKNVAYRIPNSTIEEMPLNKLISGAEMLFGQLRRNTKTEPHEQLMRYLLQFPTGNDYGVTSEDIKALFEIVNPSDGSVADGSIVVKIDEADAAPAVTKEQLIQIINAYFKGQQRTNALSLVDTLIQGQNQYKVNAVFELAILQKETSMGTAKTNYVIRDNNWTSYNLGHKYATPQDSVIASMRAIGTGSYYFTQGKYTIQAIGYTYCPNEPSHPTQGDDWVACVSSYVVSMYNCINVDVSNTSTTSSGLQGKGKLKELFPNGIPTTESEVRKYLVTVPMPITTKSGQKTTKNVTVHKAIVNDLRSVLQRAQSAGFKVYDIQGFSYRNVSGTNTLSQHSLGLAVDINVTENYCIQGGRIISGSFWRPGENEFSIPSNGVLVNAFRGIGWGWGGSWSSKKDYMHFSYTGY